MRAGNGRHRRPRQAPAIVVAAGVTGSALAMPLMAATGASAADTGTWDQVAQCESGGTWSAAGGGGLGISQDAWEQNGGRAYAPRPDLASRSQQIAVAESMLDGQGPGAWGSCGAGAGLSRGSKVPEVDPGATQTPAPRAPAPERTTPPVHGPSSSAPSDGASGEAKPAPGTATPGGSASTSPAAPSSSPSDDDRSQGRHRKDGPAPTPSTGSTAPSGTPSGTPSGRPSTDPANPHPSLPGTPSGSPSGAPSDAGPGNTDTTAPGSGKHRAEPPRSDDGRVSRGGSDARTGGPTDHDYTVRPGDNLSAIAEDHSVKGGWHSLYENNQKVVGNDPDLIQPGQRLDLGR